MGISRNTTKLFAVRKTTTNMPKFQTYFHKTPSLCLQYISVRNLSSKQLVCKKFGDPLTEVNMEESEVPPLNNDEVLVKMLAAPVNPADINTIQGKYPVKLSLPIIPGNEGVGMVEKVGNAVQEICPGNKVIITKPALGTWREFGTFNKEFLRVVPEELGVVEAATLSVNPCTAYRMLYDFVPVKQKGLVVILNAANSACGQSIIQLCKAWGIQNIGVVRNRPEIEELRRYLQCLGATFVLTEEELRTTNIFKDKLIKKPTLALNAVGGKNASDCMRLLQHSGKMVTYGGMSRKPVSIATSAFIFKNISFHGFWVTRWNEQANKEERDRMMSDIICLMMDKKLLAPVHKLIKFCNYKEALKNALSSEGFIGAKYVLDFR